MILGITGISGSGKHTAADFFGQKGWTILDADRIAHKLYRPYTALWKAVTEHFGEIILSKNDQIDRQKLGAIVFGDQTGQKLDELNKLTHPEILRYIKNEIHYLNRKKRNTVVVGALWHELGMPDYCDAILLIQAIKELAFERVHKRDGASPEMYEMRIKNQKDLPSPDFTVQNVSDFQAFYKELNRVMKSIENAR